MIDRLPACFIDWSIDWLSNVHIFSLEFESFFRHVRGDFDPAKASCVSPATTRQRLTNGCIWHLWPCCLSYWMELCSILSAEIGASKAKINVVCSLFEGNWGNFCSAFQTSLCFAANLDDLRRCISGCCDITALSLCGGTFQCKYARSIDWLIFLTDRPIFWFGFLLLWMRCILSYID